MTQMLRRGSFQATEMEVYKLAKVSNKRNRLNLICKFFLKIHLTTVYFMFKLLLTLRIGMSEVVEDEWLSEKFRLEIAKKAIDRNKQIDNKQKC